MRRFSTNAGFTLLEVMVALAILVGALGVLVQTQATAMVMTYEAERMVTATELARDKMGEVMLQVEEEGFQSSDVSESGDFSNFGSDVLDLEFGDALEDYHYEYTVREVELSLSGDLMGMMDMLGGDDEASGMSAADANQQSAEAQMSSLGVSESMITDMLSNYLREVKVRVWWGDSSDEAEERGDEVWLVTHVINPAGDLTGTGANQNRNDGFGGSDSSSTGASASSRLGGTR